MGSELGIRNVKRDLALSDGSIPLRAAQLCVREFAADRATNAVTRMGALPPNPRDIWSPMMPRANGEISTDDGRSAGFPLDVKLPM